MNPIRWHKPKWLPKVLAMPIPEPSQQATRIQAIQRNIVLPVKLLLIADIYYYLFVVWSPDIASVSAGDSVSAQEVALEFLQHFFIFYLIFNAVAAAILILRRFPPRLVPWVVFTVGLVDGLLLAGLTAKTGGFGSILFWVFPGLIVINALSIPLATPQIVLNLSLCACYLAAGILNISLSEPESGPLAPRPATLKLSKGDIVNPRLLALKLEQPSKDDGVSRYLTGQLSPLTHYLLSYLLSNYAVGHNGGANLPVQPAYADDFCQQALAADLNQILTNAPIYNPRRFSGITLSKGTSNLLAQGHWETIGGTNMMRLNRALLSDAYPKEISKIRRQEHNFMGSTSYEEPPPTDTGTESFILRLIILLLMTAACYGVQLLSFRQRMSDEEVRKSAARNDELRAAGRLAAEIAHQLKNPLGIINNAAFSLHRGLKDGKNDFNLQIGIIREEIERSDRIITQLMGYAQLSEGRVEKLDLCEDLDRAITEVFPPGTTYDIQIHRHYGANLPGLLMQRNHFSVVLVNVLQNAREALKGRGNIHVHARSPDEGLVEVKIEDDGPGIAPEKQEKVFEAYFTTKEKGTGLGLAIVKHNVELYGGDVWVESELGKGARFMISFPAKTLIKTA
jgi:signal transduction histidine kinase